jgi:L-lysine exporter family protein LysE/ArgO
MEMIFFEGFFLQASLIFALGAQNIFVIESGLRREHHLTVSLVCFLCDFTLIMLGVAGAATLFNHFPFIKIAIGILGVGFLFAYGVQKFRGHDSVVLSEDNRKKSLVRSIILAATFSILNPHAYLDAFILIGGFAAKYAELESRLLLGLGAAIFSGVWFLTISTLAGKLKELLLNPLRIKTFMQVAGLALILLSGKLGVEVISWIPLESLARPMEIVSYQNKNLMLFSTILY